MRSAETSEALKNLKIPQQECRPQAKNVFEYQTSQKWGNWPTPKASSPAVPKPSCGPSSMILNWLKPGKTSAHHCGRISRRTHSWIATNSLVSKPYFQLPEPRLSAFACEGSKRQKHWRLNSSLSCKPSATVVMPILIVLLFPICRWAGASTQQLRNCRNAILRRLWTATVRPRHHASGETARPSRHWR